MRHHPRIAFLPGVVIHPATPAASASTDLLGVLASGRGRRHPARISHPRMVGHLPAAPRFAASFVFADPVAGRLAPATPAPYRVAGEADTRHPMRSNSVDPSVMPMSCGIVSAWVHRAAPSGEADTPGSVRGDWNSSDGRALTAWLGRVSGHVSRDRTTSAIVRPAGAAREFGVFQR